MPFCFQVCVAEKKDKNGARFFHQAIVIDVFRVMMFVTQLLRKTVNESCFCCKHLFAHPASIIFCLFFMHSHGK